MKEITPLDLSVIAGPPVVGLALAQFNTVLATVSLLLGMAFQIWKWRRDSRASKE